MDEILISHALVLPDINFFAWFEAAKSYATSFERVVVVRSPAGNDLNRFFTVTAVEAPGVWFNNDALTHIRRAYPNVVRVDLIRANTPQELQAILDERVRLNDRYGETMNSSQIDDRFILAWPSDARPVKVTRPFGEDVGGVKNEGMDIFAPEDTIIRAGAAGQVVTVVREQTDIGYGQYVQTATQLNGVTYLVIYAHLKDIAVNMNDMVEVGDELGRAAAGESIKIVVQRPGDGLDGYSLPDVIDPSLVFYWPDLKLRSTVNGLRIRERPGTDFDILAKINIIDKIETLEPHGRTFQKLGVDGEWVKVRTSMGTEGYTAAWLLTVSEPISVDANFLGMNLDARHHLGNPDPSKLNGVQWVRFGYDVSMESGSTDINHAFNVYKPAIERQAAAGKKVLIVFT
ncbi:MAG: hypothetical protein CUN54_08030, partial [Phototrophicales bacterium]